MNERRLQPVGQRAQEIGSATAACSAHNHNAGGGVDPRGRLDDISIAWADLGARPQRGNAGRHAFSFCRQYILRQGEVSNARSRVSRSDRLMDHARRLRRRNDCLRVQGYVAKQQIGFGRLEEVDALHLTRHLTRKCQHRRVISTGLVQSRHEVRAAGACRTGTDTEPACQLCLARCGQRCALFVANADPFDAAFADGIPERIKRVPDQPENLFDADLFEHIDENFRYGLRHRVPPGLVSDLSAIKYSPLNVSHF